MDIYGNIKKFQKQINNMKQFIFTEKEVDQIINNQMMSLGMCRNEL